MRVLLAGATGYIGQAVLQELIAEGHDIVALVRPGRRLSLGSAEAVTVAEAAITSDTHWDQSVPAVDAVISCLASRNGAQLMPEKSSTRPMRVA